MSRKTVVILVVLAVAVVIGLLVYFGRQSPRPELPASQPASSRPESKPAPTRPAPPLLPATTPFSMPAAAKTINGATYIAENGRMYSSFDVDADGIYDADEMLMYGTLRYDPTNRTSIIQIDLPTKPMPRDPVAARARWAKICEFSNFREMAKRPLRPEEDKDNDRLPDEWEMKFFGTLKYGPWDDPDGDGFPNLIEYYRGTDPSKIDLLNPIHKPKNLERLIPSTHPWAINWDIHQAEFWEAQEKALARVRAGEPVSEDSWLPMDLIISQPTTRK